MNSLIPILVLTFAFSSTTAIQMRTFGNQDAMHDKEHIKQHLEDKIDVNKVEFDADQERFHYFTIHDLNKDHVIDGVELIKAITHTHEDTAHTSSDEELEKIVDKVLQEMDENGDGFISYAEYSAKQ